MAKLSRKKLQEIIEQADPSAKLVDTSVEAGARRTVAPDFDTPDLGQLRAKFLGEGRDPKPAKAGKAGKAAKAPAPDEEVSIVSVEKKQKRRSMGSSLASESGGGVRHRGPHHRPAGLTPST